MAIYDVLRNIDDVLSKRDCLGLSPDISAVIPSIPKMPDSVTNPAKWTYSRLVEYINRFESDLNFEQEIGACLVSFGSILTFHIISLGYYGPDIITFYGKDDKGNDVQLIQNTAQLNVLLIAMPKIGDTPRRIGFKLSEQDQDSE